MVDILHRLSLGAPPDQVLAAITTAEGVRSWWTRDADLDGSEGIFRFPRYAPDAVTRVRVEPAPGRRVVWAVTASFHSEWLGTYQATSGTHPGTTLRTQPPPLL